MWLATAVVAAVTVPQGSYVRVEGVGGSTTVRFLDRTVKLWPQEKGPALALVAVGATTKPGDYVLEQLDPQGRAIESRTVHVADARFPVQNIRIAKRQAELKPSGDESQRVKAFLAQATPRRYWAEPMRAPLASCMGSHFGVRRAHNGRFTGDYHGGVDQRGALGTPVRAAFAGVVRIAHEFPLRGGTLALDHGQGVETMYFHLSKFAVAEGAEVRQGDVVAYVGSTGRSTGPHLHWSLYANGVSLNPEEWVPLKACAAAPAKKGRRAPRKAGGAGPRG
jgi:murein DD-endopeptidase MepM/ murein hydrolase activator NlpD